MPDNNAGFYAKIAVFLAILRLYAGGLQLVIGPEIKQERVPCAALEMFRQAEIL